MKKFIVTVNGKKYDVEVEEVKADVISEKKTVEESAVKNEVKVSGGNTPVEIKNEAKDGAPINAPMPGTILDVKVSQGQTVRKGDVLLILEAMKMENEITSPYDGTVTSINVSKGASVNTGDVLLYLK
ncbi:MAG: glutaconyl-CoA/methylmalonyl-CoA decarboxylase subunit gamma [Thermoanaerobacterium sp.]|jgi:biotin carboxyl carrier protein|uniref:Biotin carboxyl carrier protein n=1 Tax=Thermoanaerobacterium butyriciformans TaxID=1702242 RepID=A0ABS4NEH4_9THEO|nr:biotin/lipoyl-containing protein [Thermoanaerobacterium butyriciformans]MBP2072061.1 biotin carboxyl carrier protein [Thermoanaerobacterium butyriciformans]MDI3478798.1 glutaconyl-CoA/methylmalonyl-CoA decarboxylase subunit gamma [Thermoanaerobacterium sp.]WHE07475.1 biotin/lipoyl-binding protein [Thermoanaerobacterium thermosaccharolyticum]